MIHIISSSSERYPTTAVCVIDVTRTNKPTTLLIARKRSDRELIAFDSLKVEILDEEKSKSFMGSAGIGLVGAAVFGPVGLLAGVLAGGNKQTSVFGLTFTNIDAQEVRLIVKTSNKDEINFLKQKSFLSVVSKS